MKSQHGYNVGALDFEALASLPSTVFAPIRSSHGEGQQTANQSRSLDHLRRPDVFLTAMATAFF